MSLQSHRIQEAATVSQAGPQAASASDSRSSPTCRFCKATFSDEDALRHHKWQMIQQEHKSGKGLVHIYCHICDKDFKTCDAGQMHWEQSHSKKQNIACPGCSIQFPRLSGFIKHIECNMCPNITQETAAARCRASLDFASALSRLDEQTPGLFSFKGPKNFGLYLGHDPKPVEPASWDTKLSSNWETKDSGTWGLSETDVHRDIESSSIPNFLTGDESNSMDENQGATNLWVSDNYPPSISPAQNRTPQQLQGLDADLNSAIQRACAEHTDPNHPDSPYFDVEQYWNKYTRKYKCPRDRCKKTFTNKVSLVKHLNSPTHSFGKVFTCPNCLSRFPALHALASHCESASLKCNIRYDDMYERFLSQLTWNLVEITGRHKEDGTHVYDISKEAKSYYGVVEVPKTTVGNQQVKGSRNVSETVTASRISHSCLTEGALAQHQQQQQHMSTISWQSTQVPAQQQQKQQFGAKAVENMALTSQALSKHNDQEAQKAEGRYLGQVQQGSEDDDDVWSQGHNDWSKRDYTHDYDDDANADW